MKIKEVFSQLSRQRNKGLSECINDEVEEIIKLTPVAGISAEELFERYKKVIDQWSDIVTEFEITKKFTCALLKKAVNGRIIFDEITLLSEAHEKIISATMQLVLRAVYMVSEEYEVDFCEIFYHIMTYRFIMYKENTPINYQFRWSFESFEHLYDTYAEEGRVEVVEDDIDEIFNEFFVKLFVNARKDDFEFLSKFPGNYTYGHGVYIKSVLDFYFNEVMSKSLNQKRVKNDEISYGIIGSNPFETCRLLASVNTYDFAKALTDYYPAFVADAYRFVLYNKLTDNLYTAEKGEELMRLLQKMADLKEYCGVEFDIKPWYSWIIKTLMHNYTGIELNFAVDILTNYFCVSTVDIESEIESCTGSILNSFNMNSDNGELNTILNLLSNKTVFEYVYEANYSVIQMFF